MTGRWWVAALVLTAACAGTGDTRILVFAAASLTDAFDVIEAEFEAASGVEVEINYAGSSTRAAQILEGAPADVFASADLEAMERVLMEGLVTSPSVFATNVMTIAVPAGNPAGIDGLADLQNENLFVGLCAEPVPCGRAARQVFANAGLVPAVDTEEPDVRSLLTKVEAGELDAGIVYSSDIRSGTSEVDEVPIDAAVNVIVSYPIAASPGAGLGARDFVSFVLSDPGEAILTESGFGS